MGFFYDFTIRIFISEEEVKFLESVAERKRYTHLKLQKSVE